MLTLPPFFELLQNMSLAGKKNNIATRSQKNSTSSMSNNENEVWKCNICKNSFTENTDKIVQYEYCSECFCSKCLSLSKNEYDTFKNPSLHWFCPNCEEKVMKNLKSDREIEVRCAEFMQKMECRLVNLETEMKSKVNTEQVNDIVKSLIGTCGTGNEAVSVDIEKSVELKLSEIRDSSSREKNIIIHGVKESPEKLPSDRKEADKHFFSELLEYLHADSNCFSNVVRIGKKTDDNEKSRPMKVTLSNTESKKSVMKNLSRLKNTGTDSQFHNISVTHDMTKTEREQNKAKINEAKEKTESDKSGKYHFIVRGPPWARRIVRVLKEE